MNENKTVRRYDRYAVWKYWVEIFHLTLKMYSFDSVGN